MGAGSNTVIGGTGTFPVFFTAISEGGILVNINRGTTNFTLGPITGGAAGEYVNTFAITVLSQGGSFFFGSPGTVTVTASFSDNTPQTLSRNITEAAGAGDTLFSFAAPGAASITGVSFTPTNFVRLVFDDLAFTTQSPAAVPEPGVIPFALVMASGIGMLAFRRRRG